MRERRHRAGTWVGLLIVGAFYGVATYALTAAGQTSKVQGAEVQATCAVIEVHGTSTYTTTSTSFTTQFFTTTQTNSSVVGTSTSGTATFTGTTTSTFAGGTTTAIHTSVQTSGTSTSVSRTTATHTNTSTHTLASTGTFTSTTPVSVGSTIPCATTSTVTTTEAPTTRTLDGSTVTTTATTASTRDLGPLVISAKLAASSVKPGKGATINLDAVPIGAQVTAAIARGKAKAKKVTTKVKTEPQVVKIPKSLLKHQGTYAITIVVTSGKRRSPAVALTLTVKRPAARR